MSSFYTDTNGCPINGNFSSGIEKNNPNLNLNFHLLNLHSIFNQERIPERVVHSKGSGAYGFFEVTDDITDICGAKFLNEIGKKTKVFSRFSTVAGEIGSSDSVRDVRGFSTKFYTEEGNLDLVYNNTPVFFLKDPAKFPYFIHSQKRNPETNLKDASAYWDYLVTNKESMHQVMILFSDRGTPASFRTMNGYSGHTYKWFNDKSEPSFVVVHFISDQGIKNLTNEEEIKMAKDDPDYLQKDLYENIARGNFPSWTCYIQTMSFKDAIEAQFSIHDLTKVWPHKKYPLRRFGRLTLNENPKNYFAEVEQAAFSPSNTVPHMLFSDDPVLQMRLFSYSNAQRYRLGVNYNAIPVNCPIFAKSYNPIFRDGLMRVDDNLKGSQNYLDGKKCNHLTSLSNGNDNLLWSDSKSTFSWESSEDDLVQPRKLWNVLKTTSQDKNLIKNVANHAINANENVQKKVVDFFSLIDFDLGNEIKKKLDFLKNLK